MFHTTSKAKAIQEGHVREFEANSTMIGSLEIAWA